MQKANLLKNLWTGKVMHGETVPPDTGETVPQNHENYR